MLSGGLTDEEVAHAVAQQSEIPANEMTLLRTPGSTSGEVRVFLRRKISVRDIRFTQDTISSKFRDGRPIYQLLNDLQGGLVDPLWDLEPLDVVFHSGRWRSLSNRRLFILKTFAAMGDQEVQVHIRAQAEGAEFHAKSTTKNDGLSVQVVQSRCVSPASASSRPGSVSGRSPRGGSRSGSRGASPGPAWRGQRQWDI